LEGVKNNISLENSFGSVPPLIPSPKRSPKIKTEFQFLSKVPIIGQLPKPIMEGPVFGL